MGIYAIRCTADGRVYVGQSRRILGRWQNHLKELREGRGLPKIQKAWDKYGPDAFSFEVLETVTIPGDLQTREQHYIDTLDAVRSGLNTLTTAGSFKGYTPDEDARKKIGDAARNRPPEVRARMRAAKLGKKRGPQSPETRAKISISQKGKPMAAIQANLGRKHTEEAKRKMSIAKRAKRMEREANRVA
jgi:group I intron endonuclease